MFDKYPESDTLESKSAAQTARMAYSRSITWLSGFSTFSYTSSPVPWGPAGSHAATVSHVMSTHLAVIEAILHVLGSLLVQDGGKRSNGCHVAGGQRL